jgi:hypothetical protein
MRYQTTALKIMLLMGEFNIDNESRLATWAGNEPTAAQIQESIATCRNFIASVNKFIQSETDCWVQEFTTAISEIDKNTKAHPEITQGGAVNINLTNGDKSESRWQLTIDNGSPESQNGNTAAVRGLLPGTHTILALGKINGTSKKAARSVYVSANSVAEVEMVLT